MPKPAIIIADAAAKYNLKMSRLSEKTTEELRKTLPKTASLANPIDIIGDADHTRYENALRVVLGDPNLDSCIVISTPQMMLNMESLADVIIKIKKEFKEKTILSCMMAISGIENALARLDENKIPQYSFPESSARAIVAMQEYKAWIVRSRTGIRKFDVCKDDVRTLFAKVKNQGRIMYMKLKQCK